MKRSHINSHTASSFLVFVPLMLLIVAVIGWIANIAKIVGALNDPISNLFVARCVGAIVMPIGAILGFF